MSAFGQYMLATAEREKAQEQYNHASANLRLKQVMERLAEVRSQHQPLADLMASDMPEREKLYSIAFYVAVGRMPEPGQRGYV